VVLRRGGDGSGAGRGGGGMVPTVEEERDGAVPKRGGGGACGGHGAGRAVEVHAEEEWAPVGVWQGDNRVRI
jgi:hypothetical protein